MRVLVTGGAGFLGSHLVDRLLAAGHVVDVIDDLSAGSLANLAAARADASRAGAALKIHTLDVRAPELGDLVERRRPELVYHLAAAPPSAGERAVFEVAVSGTLNVLEAARRAGVTKVVAALDALTLYGEVASRELPVKESHPWTPLGVAGVAARTVCDLLTVYRSEHAIEHTVLALAEVYGPRQVADRGLVAALLAASRGGPLALPDPRRTRDFVYVDDVVDALVRAGVRGSGLVVNIGTGVQTSVRELARAVLGGEATTVGPAAERVDDGAPLRFAVSPARARIHLAWSPWTSIAEGLTLLGETSV